MTTPTPSEHLLVRALEECGYGTAMLTPPPRGGTLQGEPARKMYDLLEAAENEGAIGSLVYANCCFALGRYEQAERGYRGLLAQDARDATARFNLALALLRQKTLHDAVREFDSLIAQEPSLREAYYQRGNARDEMGDVRTGLVRLRHRHQALPQLPAGLVQPRRRPSQAGPPRRGGPVL